MSDTVTDAKGNKVTVYKINVSAPNSEVRAAAGARYFRVTRGQNADSVEEISARYDGLVKAQTEELNRWIKQPELAEKETPTRTQVVDLLASVVENEVFFKALPKDRFSHQMEALRRNMSLLDHVGDRALSRGILKNTIVKTSDIPQRGELPTALHQLFFSNQDAWGSALFAGSTKAGMLQASRLYEETKASHPTENDLARTAQIWMAKQALKNASDAVQLEMKRLQPLVDYQEGISEIVKMAKVMQQPLWGYPYDGQGKTFDWNDKIIAHPYYMYWAHTNWKSYTKMRDSVGELLPKMPGYLVQMKAKIAAMKESIHTLETQPGSAGEAFDSEYARLDRRVEEDD